MAWWDTEGPFAPLHVLNPVRMAFMVDVLKEVPVFKNWTHLDVGCGGGLVSEPFARLGAHVTGLDADDQAISVARVHAQGAELDITYHAQSIEVFRKGHKQELFDTVSALEIIEHVDAPDVFLDELTACVRPGGIVFLSTLNRTIKSFALGVIAAEYILGWVPRGTHDWRKFMRPSDLTARMRARGCDVVAASGIMYRPVAREFALAPHDLDVNYIMAFQRAG